MKKNVLILASTLWIGGMEVVIAQLCRNLDKNKFKVVVCHLKERGDIGDQLFEEGINIEGIPKSNIFKRDYFTIIKLQKIIRKHKIDIVHSHTTFSLLIAGLNKFIFNNFILIHTYHYGNYPHLSKRYLWFEKYFSKYCDRLVAVGINQEKKISYYLKIPKHRVDIVWNGVNLENQNSEIGKLSNFKSANKIVIGTTATLIEQKGLTYLIDVANILKQKKLPILFLIAGEGSLRKELQEKITRLGLQNQVILMGWVQKAASVFLPIVDVFFLPSLWEAMSISIIEAMGSGKPIVCTNVGDNGYVLEQGKSGFILPPKDINGMAQALESLVMDVDLRNRMGEAARERFLKYFTVDRMVENYERLYFDLLNS